MADARAIASSDRENFVVLSKLVPPRLRDDFAAVYAFCRHADDLADERGPSEKARAEAAADLAEARVHLHAAVDNLEAPPLFTNLARTIRAHRIPLRLFDDLLDAFEQDQRVNRYQTWDQLLGYCRRSADPVGRIVLVMAGHRPSAEDPASAELEIMSDKVCTGLQLANFWQDVRSDLLDRDRVYMPFEITRLSPEQLRGLAEAGRKNADAQVRFLTALVPLVRRTRPLFEDAADLHRRVNPAVAAPVWLFRQAGIRLLERIEAGGCCTLWTRPRVSRADRLRMMVRAWLIARRAGG
jgi:squalene synthase HpnC